MLAKQGLRKNPLDGRKQLDCSGEERGQEELRPTEQGRSRTHRKGWRALLHRRGHQLVFVSCLQRGTGLRVVSPASVTPPTFSFQGFCVSVSTHRYMISKDLNKKGYSSEKGWRGSWRLVLGPPWLGDKSAWWRGGQPANFWVLAPAGTCSLETFTHTRPCILNLLVWNYFNYLQFAKNGIKASRTHFTQLLPMLPVYRSLYSVSVFLSTQNHTHTHTQPSMPLINSTNLRFKIFGKTLQIFFHHALNKTVYESFACISLHCVFKWSRDDLKCMGGCARDGVDVSSGRFGYLQDSWSQFLSDTEELLWAPQPSPCWIVGGYLTVSGSLPCALSLAFITESPNEDGLILHRCPELTTPCIFWTIWELSLPKFLMYTF